MPLLYSNVPPLKVPENGLTLFQYLKSKATEADTLYIATGYASKNALLELGRIVSESRIKKTVLVLGMYYIEGFPESIYKVQSSAEDKSCR